MRINKDFLYPRMFYDFGKTNTYYKYQADDIVTTSQYGLPFIIWYKDNPLTKKQLSKTKLSFNELEKQSLQFVDDYTWNRLNAEMVKVSGCITGAAIFFNAEVRKRLLNELGTHCIMIYDDNSIWAMSIDSQDTDWIHKAFSNSNFGAKGRYLMFGTATEYQIIRK
jgi:hypothetical protein